MDPPQPPPPLLPIPTTETLTTTTVGGGEKLRLMCSYGGYIIPRPHDKALSYVGGETRIVAIDRTTSLTDLFTRLSKTLINGRKFVLKYQLPNDDLDSLITVTTDEDLENMIDEYDRLVLLSSNSGRPGRIRLFLFPEKPDGPASVGFGGLGLVGVGNDGGFVDSINGLGLRRGFSDPVSVNYLLGLDNGVENCGGGGGVVVKKLSNVEVQSVLNETNSSFESTCSTLPMLNLGHIRVHVEDNGARVSEVKADGVRVSEAKVDGIRFSEAKADGVRVSEAKVDGFRVSEAKADGVRVSGAKVDGVRVPEAKVDGVRVSDAMDSGVRVLETKDDGVSALDVKVDGVRVSDVKADEVRVSEAMDNGVRVLKTKDDGVRVSEAMVDGVRAMDNGVRVLKTKDDGVRVSEAKVDGVRVSEVKADGVRVSEAMDKGFTILEVKDDMVRVSESKVDGVSISVAKVDGVRVSEAKFNGVGGIEEQFGQFSIGVNNNDNKKQFDDGFVAPVVGPTVTAVPMVAIGVVGNGSEFVPQAVGQPVNSAQAQQKQMGDGGELGFSDSFASNNSLLNSATQVSNRSNQLPPTTIDLNGHIQGPNSGYTFTPQYDPQHHHQLFHYQHEQPLQPPHPPPPSPRAVPLPTLYQIYPHQQYQVYYVPVGQAPAYHLHPQQPPNVGEKVVAIPSTHPQPHQNPNLITTSTRVATVSGSSLVQSHSQPQMQQQYMGYSKIHHQSQSIAPNTAPNAAYAYELVDSAYPQMYYTRPTVAAAQYQAVTSSANIVLPNCSMPNGNDDLKQRILSS